MKASLSAVEFSCEIKKVIERMYEVEFCSSFILFFIPLYLLILSSWFLSFWYSMHGFLWMWRGFNRDDVLIRILLATKKNRESFYVEEYLVVWSPEKINFANIVELFNWSFDYDKWESNSNFMLKGKRMNVSFFF